MKRLRARTVARVWGSKNAWSLAAPKGREATSRECDVEVEIQGDERNGFHLVMRPQGFFTADTHSPTLEDVLSQARELFGLEEGDWSKVED